MKNIYGLILCSLMLLMSACEKDTLATNFAPGVTTGSSTDIYRKGAVLSGSMRQVGTAAIKSYGILFSELESMAEYTEYPITDKSTDFSVSLSTLTPGTTYYYCAYAHSGYNMAKGEVKSFTTPESNAPIFEEISVTEKDEFGCTVSVSLLDDGGNKITLSGFCWTKQGEGEPTTDDNVLNASIANNALAAAITGWEPDSEYLVRAYAVNSDGVGYSKIISVRTNEATAPVLSSITQKESSNFSVTVEATISDAGTTAVSKAGFCWSTTKEFPTVDDSVNDLTAQLVDGDTTFSSLLEDLTPNTIYYIRAYATNEQGTSYSEVFTFTTDAAKIPTLSAITKKESSDFSITVEAEVKDAGTSDISKVGFCWSASKETPTVNDSINDMTSQLVDGNTIFSSLLTDFAPSTTYYIRAYATNEQGTSYSEVFTFTTAEAKAPTLSVITKKESSDFSVTVEAEVTDAGTTAISKAGFCWSTTSETPTVDDSTNDLTAQLVDGNTTFSSSLADLTPGATYYIRAYATNEQGTSYSEVFTFKTAEAKAPTLSAITKKESSDFSVTVEAKVTDAGTTAISKAGFCWSTTSETPTVDDSTNDLTAQLIDSNTTFSSSLADLTPNTTYYIRAYATNEQGTSYSEVFTFTTAEAKAPTLSGITKKESSDFSVTVEAKVTDAGTTAISKAGFCWSTTSETPTVDDSTNDLTAQLVDGSTTFSSSLADLTPNTTYYIRAYATNEQGTSYSEVFTFTTAEAKAPTLSVITKKESSDFSVTVEATVTDAGTTAISKAGFCWSTTSQTPTVDDSTNDLTALLVDGNTTFSSSLADLTPNTTYYIRAYATNEQGTSYSEVFTFKTPYKNADNGNTGINPLPTTKWE